MKDPKSKVRNPKEARSPKLESRKPDGAHGVTRHTLQRALPLVVGCSMLVVGCLPLLAQYAIDWHTIDGGGGTSTGGVYSVSVTIGQSDSGAMSGGNFTLQGGFWGIIAAVQTPGAPSLSIFRTTTNTVAVTWPSPSTGWALQQNTNSVSSVNWSNITSGIQDDGMAKTFVVNPPAGNRFYRLRSP